MTVNVELKLWLEFSSNRKPAMQAFIKVTIDPAIIALKAIPASSDFLFGAIVPSPPI